MKKLLIIQQDEAYFLFETLQVLEKSYHAFKNYELTVLTEEKSLVRVYDRSHPLIKGITTDSKSVEEKVYDLSINLSLEEKSWELHGRIKSEKKLGAYYRDGQLQVDDLWSTHLLTLKARAPFLTFHLQDLYRNILGLKGITETKKPRSNIRQIAFGATNPKLFSPSEQEELIHELSMAYPQHPLKDISEVDLISDVSQTLYVGPATLDALKFCEAGGKGIFLSSGFQGFNFLPYSGDHIILSTRGATFKARALFTYIEKEIQHNRHFEGDYALYQIDHSTFQGAYLESLNQSDDTYPFYQSHLVLWSFLLSLQDSDLKITKCSPGQVELLRSQKEVLSKFIRLHDYAMASIDTIYQESKASEADASKISGHVKNLLEIEKVSDQIAGAHSLLRPILDFYRIRRGQNHGISLLDQSQTSFLVYSEEHQALKALEELFSVTLRKNEVNI